MAELGAVELAQFTKDLDDTKKMIFQTQYASERKDRGTAVILAIFLYDRIWLGDTAMGIIKIITLGACGIWTLIDLFTAGSRCDEYNRRKAQEIVQALRSAVADPPAAPYQPGERAGPIASAPPAAFCSHCGTPTEEGSKFCTGCGKEI